jgi:hypothetical protein
MLKILPQLRGAAAGKYKNNFDTKHAYEICGYICSDDETWRIIKHIFSFVFLKQFLLSDLSHLSHPVMSYFTTSGAVKYE